LQPDGSSSYANPYDNETDANIVVIIAGNPKGIYSAHHEKLVLIDAECPPHTVAFTGVRALLTSVCAAPLFGSTNASPHAPGV
jgi:hypothetical protein